MAATSSKARPVGGEPTGPPPKLAKKEPDQLFSADSPKAWVLYSGIYRVAGTTQQDPEVIEGQVCAILRNSQTGEAYLSLQQHTGTSASHTFGRAGSPIFTTRVVGPLTADQTILSPDRRQIKHVGGKEGLSLRDWGVYFSIVIRADRRRRAECPVGLGETRVALETEEIDAKMKMGAILEDRMRQFVQVVCGRAPHVMFVGGLLCSGSSFFRILSHNSPVSWTT